MRILVIPGLLLLLSSCASILNGPTQTITIITSTPSKVIVNADTLVTTTGRLRLSVERKPEDLVLTVANDSLVKMITLKSKSSWAYWLNAYPAPLLGLGLWLERDKPERYTYPGKLHINLGDTEGRSFMAYSERKSSKVRLHFSVPYVNSFLLKPDGEVDQKISSGFLGMSGGFDYAYSATRYFNLTVTGATDFLMPIPVPLEYEGEYKIAATLYASVSHNHELKRFSAGYGLSFSRNLWRVNYNAFSADTPPPTREPARLINDAIGLVVPVYYRVSRHFYVGTVYRPTLLRLDAAKTFDYEHLISLDLAWKIGLGF